MDWWVYIVDKSGKLYVGITTDIDNRLRQHGNPPLLHKEGPMIKVEAVNRERQIKGWNREKKQSLCEKMPEKQM